MVTDEGKWWNKLASMSKEEMELLPLNFARKYAGYLYFLRSMGGEARLDENRNAPYYKMIKSLRKL